MLLLTGGCGVEHLQTEFYPVKREAKEIVFIQFDWSKCNFF